MCEMVHLHNHTQYSLLDGACRINDLLDKCDEHGMKSIAMTDHGNMFGTIEFFTKAKERSIKPIIGCEVYMAGGDRRNKEATSSGKQSYHLTLLAESFEGYKNLIQLTTKAYLEGFYYKPRIDKELLFEYNKGIICLSGCLGSELNQYILADKLDKAEALIKDYIDVFGDRYYFELMNHNTPEQIKACNQIIKFAEKFNRPLVATNDIHYCNADDAFAHEVLLCIGTKKTMNDENRMQMSSQELFFKSPQQMLEIFKETPQALKNTLEVAERCNVEIPLRDYHLPNFETPEGTTPATFLRDITTEGLKERYGKIEPEQQERADMELGIIENMGFPSYFLIVQDFCNWAKEHDIPVGPGRGSGAGSIVAYALGITGLDPLKYDLIFERFLNPERVSMPDFDIDFCFDRRQEVIDYVTEKYGEDKVSQIITFGTLAARGVVRDVARVLDAPLNKADQVAKLIPTGMKLSEALENEPDLRKMYQEDQEVHQIIDLGKRLEGLSRHTGKHAAGVVISDAPLTEYLPLYKSGDDISTQFEMSAIDEIGMLKMDFLGLRTLTLIDNAVKLIREKKQPDLDIETIPLADSKAFDLLQSGKTKGVFQVESDGMRSLLQKLKPSVFEDIIALVALYRPGPLGSGMVDDFIQCKHGLKEITYPHPMMEPVLKDTYGMILYQEQVQRLANVLANFSLGEADNLRRAMGKKKPEVMAKYRAMFVEGCVKNSVDESIGNQVFDLMEYFAGYGFNKSHSAAYGLLTYQTAFLKANYPLEFMTALLNSELGNMDKLVLYTDEARVMDIEVLPPDVRASFARFTIDEGRIRFGLEGIKNVGNKAIESIVEARQEADKFDDLFDLASNVDLRLVNKQVLEALIKAGATDTLNGNRASQLSVVDEALGYGNSEQKDRDSNQISMFSIAGMADTAAAMKPEIPDLPEFTDKEKLILEKEYLGFYISSHPLRNYETTLKKYGAKTNSQTLADKQDKQTVTMGGMIRDIRTTVTKSKGEKMALFKVEDFLGNVGCVTFPRTYKKCSEMIIEDEIVFIRGKADFGRDEPQILVDEIIPVESADELLSTELMLNLTHTDIALGHHQKVRELIVANKGTLPIHITLETKDHLAVELRPNNGFCVEYSDDLVNDIEALLGPGKLAFNA